MVEELQDMALGGEIQTLQFGRWNQMVSGEILALPQASSASLCCLGQVSFLLPVFLSSNWEPHSNR